VDTVGVSRPPARLYVVFTRGGGLAQSERTIESLVEGTFVHVFDDIEYGVATDARLESVRDRFLLLLLAVPAAYRGVKEDCRRSTLAAGV
jgi:hypothetical protein